MSHRGSKYGYITNLTSGVKKKPVAHLLALFRIHIEEAALGVVTALIQAVTGKFLVAFEAVKLDNARKKLPEEVLPGNFLRAQRQDELVELEALICHVWRLDLAVGVYEDLTFLTELPSSLTRCEERGTVSTALEHVLTVLKEDLKLFHENLALQLIFLIFQLVERFDLHFAGQSFHEARVHAVHVNG